MMSRPLQTHSQPELSEIGKVDNLLIRRFCSGDLRAFEVLVTKYQRRVAALINASVRNNAVAEELTQEAFLRAYRSLPEFRFESAFSTWLYAIARNLTMSYFRDGQEQDENSIPMDLLTETMVLQDNASWKGHAPGPDEHLCGAQLAAGIEQSIENLTPSMRSAFLLRERDDLSYQAIATQLCMPLNTVRSLIFRARATISSDIRPMLSKAISVRSF
ncbi:sigma-70 family RNA polymerase sigma factor [Janthinobacterium lividum]|jgi:RNA polymerase sigma-70 factor (ECF subfamily)|uniref:sigma-70 family RNA polymerase sigma factor n=1 Tax=Janthinobacterium sp. LB2P10 TaxID=3424194 RepID=UPI000A5DB886